MRIAGLFIIALGITTIACGRSTPEPPVVNPPAGNETVNGTERLGWDQRAGDRAELATIRYAAYVDNNRVELTGVSCSASATATGYACTAQLPQMSAGAHTIEIASFVQDGSVLESARSAALRVTVTGIAPSVTSTVPEASTAQRRAAAAAWPSNIVRVAGGFDRPSDLAVAPDGRVFVAEHTGRIRIVVAEYTGRILIVAQGRVLDEPAIAFDRSSGAGDILAIAIDPAFDRSHFVYAIVTTRARSGALSATLARFREAGHTLGDRVVLLDDVQASADARASLRFGPDGKLYARFDDGGDERLAGDAASLNGKLLRMNPDGTTPADQPGGRLAVAAEARSPRGLAWHGSTRALWSADATRVGGLAWTPAPAAIAILNNEIFVGTERGLTRSTIDARAPGGLSGRDAILRDETVTAVAATPDGRVYFTTADSLGGFTAAYK